MKVKICGITTLPAAKVVEKSGADFIGFVFAPSSRSITPEDATNIAKQLSPKLKKVGVFVNESIETIEAIATKVGLDIIQLHGDESEAFAKKLPYPIIKAFSIDKVKPNQIRSYPAEYLLIDSPGDNYRGGSGKTFSWELLDELDIPRERLILAGGLSSDNINQAIELVRPYGVDVSSGVETKKQKDHEKIKSFIAHAKQERG